MIKAHEFVDPALERGYSFWTGVPCSFLTPFINYVIQSPRLTYVGAASEGEAVGIAAGAHLAGRKTVVICQNSGLGNTVNPLTSLNYPFRIPTLLITTHRGAPGIKDEPQHELMGRITGQLLDVMGIPWEAFPDDSGEIVAALERSEKSMRERKGPFAFIMAKGAVEEFVLEKRQPRAFTPGCPPQGAFVCPPERRMARIDAIRVVREAAGDTDAIVATTGKIGRELFTLGHRSNQLYVVGSMGCASAIAFGISQALPRPPAVVALDGDGAALMKMGVFGTIGHHQPERLVHVILDNEAHESTGAQATVSCTMDFAAIASGCGYRNLWRADTPQALEAAFRDSRRLPGPNLIHVKVGIRTDQKLGRPTMTPEQVKTEFMEWLAR